MLDDWGNKNITSILDGTVLLNVSRLTPYF